MTDFPIVGIGCSAGGLEALQTLFRNMPDDPGMAFVVAAHLDPTKESHLPELLARCTKMATVQVSGQTEVRPNHVYFIAPDQELAIKDGVLQPYKPEAPRGHRHPVDSFLRSLAEDQGPRAIGIILSGTGSNGSMGLRFLKAEGGIVIVQDPETAKFTGMPQAAIGTGNADVVLAPEKMPEALAGISDHDHVRQPEKVVEEKAPRDELRGILNLLRARTGRDFSGYKSSTLLRRILRRMGLHRIGTMGEYIERLRGDEEEVKALVGDMTINVTGFFRDPKAWETLAEKVIRPLARERKTESAVRVWVPGCSTGEEAYTIAMLMTEAAEAENKSFDLRLFATDVAEGVLSTARAGRYPGSIAMDVGEMRLNRFFEQEDDTWFVRPELRDSITFAPQNLLQDPPFSRLDLVSCRNLLIYLEPQMQKRVLGLLHFALRQDGTLFLGTAETVSPAEDLFEPISKKWRIYRRVGPTRHDIMDLPLGRDRSLHHVQEHHEARGNAAEQVEHQYRAGETLDRALLDRYAPASVLIDERCNVHYLRGPTEDYLRPPSGEPTWHLISVAREGLQVPLRGAIRKSLEEKREVTVNARVKRGGSFRKVRFMVAPLGREQGRLMVTFFERGVAAQEGAAPAEAERVQDEGDLQAELDSAREDLRLTIEQMEASNEELKASNEEIRSMNEELQASNEELETSKEELQSLNEELNTVNSQLQSKVDELEESTADLNNLLEATHVATLFLDRDLCIRWSTPAMKDLFDLRHADVGRPISHFAQKFKGGDLVKDAQTVLRKLTPQNTEVLADGGRAFIRQITPYQARDGRIGGVVVSFIDITDRKEWERQLAAQKHYAESIVHTVREPLLVLKPDLTVQSANDSFYATFGVKPKETEGRKIYELGNQQWDIPELRRLLEDILPEDNQFEDYNVEHEFPEIGRRVMLLNGRRLDHVQLILLAIEDITERVRTQKALKESEQRYRTAFDNMEQGFCVIRMIFGRKGEPVDYVFEEVNAAFERETGLKDAAGKSMRDFEPEHEDFWFEIYGRIARTGQAERFEHRADKLGRDYEVHAYRVGEPEENLVAVLFKDITKRRKAETERELLARELSHRVKNTLAVVQALAQQTNGRIDSVDEYRENFLGRLQAMARAHGLLLQDEWRGAALGDLVKEAVAAYRIDHPERAEIDGKEVALTPKQALGLSLILHELGTNAAKYGALSQLEGRVRIDWSIGEDGGARKVRLRWQEHGGPQVRPPKGDGFGTRLIRQAAGYELDGKSSLEFDPEGLTCTIEFPLEP